MEFVGPSEHILGKKEYITIVGSDSECPTYNGVKVENLGSTMQWRQLGQKKGGKGVGRGVKGGNKGEKSKHKVANGSKKRLFVVYSEDSNQKWLRIEKNVSVVANRVWEMSKKLGIYDEDEVKMVERLVELELKDKKQGSGEAQKADAILNLDFAQEEIGEQNGRLGPMSQLEAIGNLNKNCNSNFCCTFNKGGPAMVYSIASTQA
ncbi:hypothetical protein VNO78_01076 [Psophocarpus tetragonolobus]|uniref:Uncharacterized protein n=1 Tax=Psophocarpus tetragonolobus TaxID=3891 RepID=A0AAN9XU47_PSOTE